MFRRATYIKLFLGLTFIPATLFASSAFGQSPSALTDTKQKDVATTPESRTNKSEVSPSEPAANTPEKKIAVDEPRRTYLQTEVDNLKAENAAVRDLLQKMAEQQKALLEQVNRLQRRLDGPTANAQPNGLTQAADANVALTNPTGAAEQTAKAVNTSAQIKPEKEDRYQDGIVIYQNSDDSKVPFLLKFNINSQIRYLNTVNSPTTFTDHLGNAREVHTRNDITVNRAMFILGGYMFSKKLQYSMTVWTSAGAASIVIAGNIGYRFNKALTITGGYTGVPGSRSLVATFPFFQTIDRSMADNFFRPGFTQGDRKSVV